MTEAEALDLAAKAAGWEDWYEILHEISHEYLPNTKEGIRAHAKTIMENAALEAKLDVARKALDRIATLDDYHAPLRPLSAPIIASAALKEIDNGDR